jgi:hypothetical protein
LALWLREEINYLLTILPNDNGMTTMLCAASEFVVALHYRPEYSIRATCFTTDEEHYYYLPLSSSSLACCCGSCSGTPAATLIIICYYWSSSGRALGISIAGSGIVLFSAAPRRPYKFHRSGKLTGAPIPPMPQTS